MRDEPVVVLVTAFMVVLNSVLVALQAFAVDLTPDQVAAVMGVGNSVGGFLIALVTRRRVAPLSRVDQ